MTPDELQELNSAESILFLGSGFSHGAINIRGDELPTGEQLKQELGHLLNVDDSQHDFQTLAEEINASEEHDLYQILYELFTVRELQAFQSDILKLNWRRIYTTNFDDAVELAYVEKNKTLKSFSYSDPKPNKIPNGSLIHLHGVIRNANEDNVLQQLILNESSYARQHFEKSVWYDEFVRDLRFCRSCFFLGYSLKDYHISSLLLQDPDAKNKTYFINTPSTDSIFENRTKPYGMLWRIGVEGFSELCRTLPEKQPVANIHTLKSFRFIDPFKDKRPLLPPTTLEILNLVTYGTFNYQRCLSTLPDNGYVVPRQELAEEALRQLGRSRCLLVHSFLGNGKSIFLYILAHKLSEHGYQCFMAKTNPTILIEDLQSLKAAQKPVIFFDSYDSAIELMDELSDQLPEVKFVVSVRTGLQDVRLHEIQSRFPKPLERANLNGVKREELRQFITLLDRSGVRAQNLEGTLKRCKDFREVVVTLYNHAEIKDKIANELEPLMADTEFRRVFVASHLLKWVGYDVDSGFLRSVTGCDAYAVIAKFRGIAGDIFSMGDDSVHVRSPMFSKYLIQNHLDTTDIIDGVYPIVVEAAKRKAERRYRGIMGSLMRFSILNQALLNSPDKFERLTELFERLRQNIEVNREPLFWLQYSILMTAADNLKMAESLIRTAYARASDNPTFRTFQIDTFALRLFLLIEQKAIETEKVSRFDEIIEKMEVVRSMIGEVSSRDQAIQVLNGIEPFVNSRIAHLSTAEKNILIFNLALIDDALDRISDADRTATRSDDVRSSIARARRRTVNG